VEAALRQTPPSRQAEAQELHQQETQALHRRVSPQADKAEVQAEQFPSRQAETLELRQ
jgi:hypothetical protein